MSDRLPALSLAAVPGRRARTIELAAEIEEREFSGIYCPSFGDAMGLCLSIAHATTTIEFGTSIQPIYFQHPRALATSAGYLHEIAEGRFRLGIGVTHGSVVERLGVETGKPLSLDPPIGWGCEVGASTKKASQAGRMLMSYVNVHPPSGGTFCVASIAHHRPL